MAPIKIAHIKFLAISKAKTKKQLNETIAPS
jgi:hypothetical protein